MKSLNICSSRYYMMISLIKVLVSITVLLLLPTSQRALWDYFRSLWNHYGIITMKGQAISVPRSWRWLLWLGMKLFQFHYYCMTSSNLCKTTHIEYFWVLAYDRYWIRTMKAASIIVRTFEICRASQVTKIWNYSGVKIE